ncbi:hypothetical protein BDZ45DRAFT_257920 [Acephala macrosclerotiorum]|nr:hypothetical protein BDZ45DRAFT_257920 [Acephala macrosclerotiorum]
MVSFFPSGESYNKSLSQSRSKFAEMFKTVNKGDIMLLIPLGVNGLTISPKEIINFYYNYFWCRITIAIETSTTEIVDEDPSLWIGHPSRKNAFLMFELKQAVEVLYCLSSNPEAKRFILPLCRTKLPGSRKPLLNSYSTIHNEDDAVSFDGSFVGRPQY